MSLSHRGKCFAMSGPNLQIKISQVYSCSQDSFIAPPVSVCRRDGQRFTQRAQIILRQRWTVSVTDTAPHLSAWQRLPKAWRAPTAGAAKTTRHVRQARARLTAAAKPRGEASARTRGISRYGGNNWLSHVFLDGQTLATESF